MRPFTVDGRRLTATNGGGSRTASTAPAAEAAVDLVSDRRHPGPRPLATAPQPLTAKPPGTARPRQPTPRSRLGTPHRPLGEQHPPAGRAHHR
ncbi:hypothetical protein [Streptomyces jumonjinensis]|uniref:hypothetical protein n=1 Tax=Streptomyces jumonjinensis TaxID=1945 RepID=UPI0037B7F1FB